jgi:site-specific recombinase XerD
MFETLFVSPSVLAQYRAAPLAEARERFLMHCENQGYSRRMLHKIAWVLLVIAQSIDVAERKISATEIEHAVDHRPQLTKQRRKRNPLSSRQLFMKFATDWLRFIGHLEESHGKPSVLANEIADFEQFMRDERGLSPITIARRCARLGCFSETLRPSHRSLKAISLADVDEFLASKGDQGCTRASVSAWASDLRSFFRYAEAQKWCAPGIAANVDTPRIFAQEGLPQGPTWRDVQRLISSTGGDSPVDIRDHAVVMLFALYGLRRSEVARLRLEDVDWAGEVLCVARPKQRCTQHYPLLPCMGEAILRYLREVRPRCVHRELFLAFKAPVRPLKPEAFSAIVSHRLAALDVHIARHGSHCLRHACASHLLASGFSYKQIGDHLGHRSASSTRNYVKVDLVGLRQVAELDLGRLL